MPRFTLDLTLRGAMTFEAPDSAAARAKLQALLDSGRLDCAEANLGSWSDGAPILAEVGIDHDDHALVDEHGHDVPL